MFAFHDEMAQYLLNMSSTYSLSLVTPQTNAAKEEKWKALLRLS